MPSEGKIVKGISKKILVVCPHPVGFVPGQRLKYEQYFNSWKENGYDIDIKPFINEDLQKILYQDGNLTKKTIGLFKGYWKRLVLLSKVRNYDLVYFFLWVTPIGLPIFEWLYSKLAKKIIFDIDDLVFLKNKTTPWYLRILKGYKKPLYLMKVADHVITCTPYLNTYVRQFNQNTTDISSTINTNLYRSRINYSFQEERPIIGWSGSHSTVRHLEVILPTLKRLREIKEFKFVVMGTEKLKYKGLDIECIPWKEEHEVAVINRFDIGIYPLPNEDWVLGKSSLKALQYMALGIPTVATAIGTNFRVIEDGVSGFLVSTEEEWVDRLSTLLEDINLRKSIGQAGAKVVERKFSIKANESNYLNVFESVLMDKSLSYQED